MPRPIRVGIQLPEVERAVRWPEYVAIARAAEGAGFDSIWMGDHLLYRDDGRPERGPWDVWTILAGLAAATERVRLGPLVACLGFHPPGVLARMAATVDEIGRGRLVLGVGAGWNEAEFRAFGLPFDHRVDRFEEAFTIVRGLLSGERVTLHGTYSRAEDAVLLPPPARRPKLMVGSTGARLLAITLPHVEAWNTWYDLYGNSIDGFERENGKVTAAAERAGRDPSEIERSACVLVALDHGAHERPMPEDFAPVEENPRAVAAHLRELSAAGADEAILVASPITETSVRELGAALVILDD